MQTLKFEAWHGGLYDGLLLFAGKLSTEAYQEPPIFFKHGPIIAPKKND